MIIDNLAKPETHTLRESLLFHLLGIPSSYLLTSYFSNFHSGYLAFVILSVSFQMVCGTGTFILLKDTFKKASWRDSWVSLAVLIFAVSVAVSSFAISRQFPALFNQRIFFMDTTLLPVFLGLAILSTPGTLWLIRILEKGERTQFILNAGIVRFLQRHRTGIFLAWSFFLTYFIFAQGINFPGHYTRDIYFETDISDWIDRLTALPSDTLFPVRAVHPAVMLFLRPPVALLSLLLDGDRLQAAFLSNALAGSACVFLIWSIVKQRTGSTPYALLSASLLGASTSHLLLGSMLETYIFSALALIFFCFLTQTDRIALKISVPAGVVIFGITITNLAQACILYFFKMHRLKIIFQFISAVILTALLLNVLQVKLYPFSEPLYRPSSLLVEQRYRHELFGTSRQFGDRVNLISRAILLYGIVAPNPYILKETPDVIVPNFRTFKIEAGVLQVAGYKGLADIIVKAWVIILGLAIILFILGLFKSHKQMGFSIGLILCMGFNFGLHLLYGDDPMLYSPNWVYALVLLVSTSLEKWAGNKWIQLGLLLFLGLMTYVNLGLIHRILSVSLPFYGG